MTLTVKQVEKLIREAVTGATADSDGLYLKVTPEGNASWQYRYQINGRRRMMGLGACSTVTLAEARDKATDARKLVKQCIDPIGARDSATAADKAKKITFKDLALAYIKDHRASWSNIKHAQQWKNTLETYAYPAIGNKAPEQINTEDVLKILKPIWEKKTETASRVRNRIELVIDSARAQGLSSASNPAAWRGHLDKLLPKLSKKSAKHHAALDYRNIPAFFKRLQDERDSLSSIALQFTILTACRTSEVLLATWAEFDLANKQWTIPAERMKARRPHRVPLSDSAMQLLEALEKREGHLFPGAKKDKPLSNMSMTMVLRKLGHTDLTVHGFRSSFRDWAAEETHYPNIVAEQVLAHVIGNAAEAAYRRGDLLEKRRALMADWASFCTTQHAENIVPIKKSNTAA